MVCLRGRVEANSSMSTFSNEDVEDFHSSILANDLDAVKLYLSDADCGADENGEGDGNIMPTSLHLNLAHAP